MSIAYPYPSHVCAPNFVTEKLSGRDMYDVWKTQMQCLLVSHDMLGFINGTHGDPRLSNLAKTKPENYMSWERSDALVKGWILGSLSKDVLTHVVKNITEDCSAKDAWDKVFKMFGSRINPQPTRAYSGSYINKNEDVDMERMETGEAESSTRRNSIPAQMISEKDKKAIQRELYKAIQAQDDLAVSNFLGRVQLTDKIDLKGNTALHLVISTAKNTHLLTKTLKAGPKNNAQLEERNSDGSTPLHVAAIVGNTEAAMSLVAIKEDLLLAKDNEGQIPLARAVSNLNSETYQYLYKTTKSLVRKMKKEMDTLTNIGGAAELVANAISSKDFRLARKLFSDFNLKDSDAVLIAMAQNFPPELSFWEKMSLKILSCVSDIGCRFKTVGKSSDENDEDRTPLYAKMWPFKFYKQAIQYKTAESFLEDILLSMDFIRNPIFEATRQNASTVVRRMLYYFPHAICLENENGHNIIQYAVLQRSEKIYSLVYQMRTQEHYTYRTIKDSLDNNLLHLAARLAPPDKLNLIPGAALQLQRELQWFKEVEKFVRPLCITQKNSFEETPAMIFTREHKDLVIQGEKWMKGTTRSYTVTATLIATIMFAAAITVPGGNKDNSGIPIFISEIAFKIFAVSDAISLISSIISLVIFLSFDSTARFAEQDFLRVLPTKLIVGLINLFISTTATIIAFGATMFLVFGKSDSSLLVLITICSCLPIAFFVIYHFPLIADVTRATYGPSFLRKKSDDPLL